MPSYFESLSMVALEAWALGRPVLANARCDVLKGQCIRSRAGLYYNDEHEFVDTIHTISENPWLSATLGQNGRQFFREHYDWNVIDRKYLDMLDRLSKEPPSSPSEPLPGWIARRQRDRRPAADIVATLPEGPSQGDELLGTERTGRPAVHGGTVRRPDRSVGRLAGRPFSKRWRIDGDQRQSGRAPGRGLTRLRRRDRPRGPGNPARAVRTPDTTPTSSWKQRPPARTAHPRLPRARGRLRPRQPAAASLLDRLEGVSRSFALPDRMAIIYHNITPPEYFVNVHRRLAGQCFRGRRELRAYIDRCDLALGDSEFNCRDLESLGFTKTAVLPVVPSFSHLERAPDRFVADTFDDDWTNVLFVGRVIPNKKIEDLIRYFHAYHTRFNPRSRLIVVGVFNAFSGT